MKTINVGAFEAKTHLSRLLDEVEKGAVVKNSKNVSSGDLLRVTLAAGELDCLVKEIRHSD